MLCVQELKAHDEQIADRAFHARGYHRACVHAEKRGYSGVAIYSRQEPDDVRTALPDRVVVRYGLSGVERDQALLAALDRAGRLLIAGEAGSHCVKATTEDLADLLPGGAPERLVLLTDCMSPVSGFERQHDDFLRRMAERGARLATSAEVLQELLG